MTGTEEDLERHPEAFLRTAGGVAAKGRDPYFAPWPDVAQLNAFAPQLREAVAETLAAIADQCDGARCDMAMLMTNEVFARTWGERAGPAPHDEYWPTLIGRTKAAHPDFLFVADVRLEQDGRHAEALRLGQRLLRLLERGGDQPEQRQQEEAAGADQHCEGITSARRQQWPGT
jgi:hypothetical protein